MNHERLEEMAEARKIRIHEPFAEFLKAQPSMHTFEISLLDCYRLSGHACHAITGAFLSTEIAIEYLFPDTKVCERGDLLVEFSSNLEELATGPKSNVISYITGSWADSGFPGLKGQFRRKNLISYGHHEIGRNTLRFHRRSNGQNVDVEYDPSQIINNIEPKLDFPEKWRVEICAILNHSSDVLKIAK